MDSQRDELSMTSLKRFRLKVSLLSLLALGLAAPAAIQTHSPVVLLVVWALGFLALLLLAAKSLRA